jgi:hypothetical protein
MIFSSIDHNHSNALYIDVLTDFRQYDTMFQEIEPVSDKCPNNLLLLLPNQNTLPVIRISL